MVLGTIMPLYHQRDIAIVCMIHASLMVRSNNYTQSFLSRAIESWLGSRSDNVHHPFEAQYDNDFCVAERCNHVHRQRNLRDFNSRIMVNLQNRKQDGTAGVTPQECALHNCWHQPCSTAAALMSKVQSLRSS